MKYEFIDKALWFPKERTLAIADLHIGHEEYMNKAGIFFPRVQFGEMMNDFEKIFEKIGKVEEIIICGDLKHEFGAISEQEWKETLAILDFLRSKSRKIILIRGNHDKILGPIANKRGIEIKDFYIKNDVCFMHGNKQFQECKKNKMIVMGHRHPAVTIADKYKKEKYKCFLVGKFEGKKVIIIPSFFPLLEGSDFVDRDNNLLFIPEDDLKNFEVFVVGDKIYDFGKLKNIGNLDGYTAH